MTDKRRYGAVPKYLRPIVIRMHEEGITYEVIARVVGCTPSRVGQIVRGEVAKLVNGKWTVGKADREQPTL